tara:strand:+ start:1584 stop:1997 length:414 start_codon:yes stop_codon:yes gene_type:complete
MSIKYNIHKNMLGGIESICINTVIDEVFHGIPIASGNRHYKQYLEDIKTHGMSIVSINDIGYGEPDDSMWQYLDNAEQLVIDKYGSDSDKLTALREHKYVRAIKAEFPYESKDKGFKIIDSTSEEIKQKYRHLPMRR